MTRVHSFSDDALGDLDTVGLVEAIQTGRVSAPEVVEAAIARIEKVNPELNGLAYAAFDRARVEARDLHGGYFCGIPTLVKDNCDVAGTPTMQGSDAFVATPKKALTLALWPIVKKWCSHTVNESTAMAIVAMMRDL